MPATKHRQTKEIVGYVILAIVVLGVIYLSYWLITEKPSRRFRGIEKIRGEVILPVQDHLACGPPWGQAPRDFAWVSPLDCRGAPG